MITEYVKSYSSLQAQILIPLVASLVDGDIHFEMKAKPPEEDTETVSSGSGDAQTDDSGESNG